MSKGQDQCEGRNEAQLAEATLESWKAIATHLNRDVRTVMRWEKSEGLPVHRHRHLARSSVYAYGSELDAWRANRRLESPPEPERVGGRRQRRLALAAMLAFGVLAAGGGRFEGPVGARQGGPSDREIPWDDDPGKAAEAAISRDGRLVSFIATTPPQELHVRDLVTGRSRRLTRIAQDGGAIMASAISTDGKRIAFASDEDDEERPGLRILPLDADQTHTPRLLVEGSYVVPEEWSRDDRQILVTVRGRSVDIGLVSVADGAFRRLTAVAYPGPGDQVVLSPDAAFVAYDARAPSRRQRDIYLISANGGAPVPMLTGPSFDAVVGWSPDGRHLIFTSDRPGSEGTGLWAQPVNSGRVAGPPVLLRSNFHGDILGMTNGGALFYELTHRADDLLVVAIDPETGDRAGEPQLIAHDRDASSRKPRWSADGRMLIYETQRPSGPVFAIQTLATGAVREIPINLDSIMTFDWSPDARQIVCRGVDLQGRMGIFLIDASTGAVRSVAFWTEGVARLFVPQFTADGRHLWFERGNYRGQSDWVERNLASGSERVRENAVVAQAGWLGDALRRSPDGRYRLGLVNLPGQSILRLHDSTTDQTRDLFRVDRARAIDPQDAAHWLPDGRAIVVNIGGARDNERELWRIPIAGGDPRRIDLGVSNLVDGAIAVHPSGRQLAFVAGRPVPSKSAVLQTEFRILEGLLRRLGR